MDPACTSDTEEDSAGDLYRMHLPWRSQKLTEFAHKLDLATVERLRKEKGPRIVHRAKLLELHRRNPISSSKVSPVPIGLPQCCYDPAFLHSRPKVAQDILNCSQEDPLEFPSI